MARAADMVRDDRARGRHAVLLRQRRQRRRRAAPGHGVRRALHARAARVSRRSRSRPTRRCSPRPATTSASSRCSRDRSRRWRAPAICSIIHSTSGDSPNVLRAAEAARRDGREGARVLRARAAARCARSPITRSSFRRSAPIARRSCTCASSTRSASSSSGSYDRSSRESARSSRAARAASAQRRRCCSPSAARTSGSAIGIAREDAEDVVRQHGRASACAASRTRRTSARRRSGVAVRACGARARRTRPLRRQRRHLAVRRGIPLGEMDDDAVAHGRCAQNMRLDVLHHARGGARDLESAGASCSCRAPRASAARRFTPTMRRRKGAMISFVKSVAVELAPRDITVNSVAPGWVDTEMCGRARSRATVASASQRTIPLGRVASRARHRRARSCFSARISRGTSRARS